MPVNQLLRVFAVLILSSGGPPLDVPDDAASAVAGGVPIGSREVFRGDFDAGDLTQWRTAQTKDHNGRPGTYDTRSISVRDGGPRHPTAARFEVRDGDVPSFGGGERAEVRVEDAGDVRSGDERWYEFSLMFEPGPNPTGGWFIPMQWHAVDNSPPPWRWSEPQGISSSPTTGSGCAPTSVRCNAEGGGLRAARKFSTCPARSLKHGWMASKRLGAPEREHGQLVELPEAGIYRDGNDSAPRSCGTTAR